MSQTKAGSGESVFLVSSTNKRKSESKVCSCLKTVLHRGNFRKLCVAAKQRNTTSPPPHSPPAHSPRHTLQPRAVEAGRTLRGPSSASVPPGWSCTCSERRARGNNAKHRQAGMGERSTNSAHKSQAAGQNEPCGRFTSQQREPRSPPKSFVEYSGRRLGAKQEREGRAGGRVEM